MMSKDECRMMSKEISRAARHVTLKAGVIDHLFGELDEVTLLPFCWYLLLSQILLKRG